MELTQQGRTKELAQFLQTRRARLSPEQVGLPAGGRRRTPGLRRSEVALLAGMSVDWYTWLEQGRDIQVSGQVLEGLVRALRLDRNERRHLFLLALGYLPSDPQEPQRTVSPLLQSFLDRQGESPALAWNARLDIVAWNQAACVVYGDYERMSPRERNSVWRVFTSTTTRRMQGDQWEKNARRRLAQFRANYGRYVDDPWWSEFIGELSGRSPEFRAWWPHHDVLEMEEGRKRITHPSAGPLSFEHLPFQVADSADLLVTVHIPLEDDATGEKIKKLLLQRESWTGF